MMAIAGNIVEELEMGYQRPVSNQTAGSGNAQLRRFEGGSPRRKELGKRWDRAPESNVENVPREMMERR